jgi:hypothetical protein
MTMTVLYYTGNKKSQAFHDKVLASLRSSLDSYDLPVVSVSQKPMDFGNNICVGNVGASYLNAYRQMYIGAVASGTEYLAFAEDDFLYPQEYFRFEPSGGDFYRYDNTWMVLWRGAYYRTKPVGGAQVAKRDFIVDRLAEYLDGEPEWADGKYWPNKPDFMGAPFELFSGPPVVAFKPLENLSRSGYALPEKTKDLHPWGNVDELRRRYDFA